MLCQPGESGRLGHQRRIRSVARTEGEPLKVVAEDYSPTRAEVRPAIGHSVTASSGHFEPGTQTGKFDADVTGGYAGFQPDIMAIETLRHTDDQIPFSGSHIAANLRYPDDRMKPTFCFCGRERSRMVLWSRVHLRSGSDVFAPQPGAVTLGPDSAGDISIEFLVRPAPLRTSWRRADSGRCSGFIPSLP